jgi:hypothetical protein
MWNLTGVKLGCVTVDCAAIADTDLAVGVVNAISLLIHVYWISRL